MKLYQSAKLSKELFWFVLMGLVSFLIWCTLALIANQDVIVDDCLYDKERIGFFVTIGVFYILRFSSSSKHAG